MAGDGGALVFVGVNQFGLRVVVAANVIAAQGAASAHAAARVVGSGGDGVDDHGLALVEQASAEVVVFVIQEELFVKKLAAKGALLSSMAAPHTKPTQAGPSVTAGPRLFHSR